MYDIKASVYLYATSKVDSLIKYSLADLSAKHNIDTKVICSWVNKWYNGIEIKDYSPKGDVYTMKSRKTTYEERTKVLYDSFSQSAPPVFLLIIP